MVSDTSSVRNVIGQISELSELQQRATQAKHRHSQIERELRAIADEEAEAIRKAKAETETRIRAAHEKLDLDVRDQLQQLEMDVAAQRDSIAATHERHLQEVESANRQEVSEVRGKLQNDLWVLQSVCDENNEDTPVRQAERAEEIFRTHQMSLDQRQGDLEQRVQAATDYLRMCHATADREYPAPTVTLRSRDAALEIATSSIDQSLLTGASIDRLSLPQWIIGFRMMGLALLIFLVVTISVTMIRADLSKYISPQFGKPDWEWLGVSALIGFASAFLITITLLMTVQSRLRTRFADMLQHAANAKAAGEYWATRSRTEVKKLEQAAERWKTEVQQKRVLHAARISATAEQQIQRLTEDYQKTVARLNQQFDEQTRTLASDHSRQQSSIEQWRAQEAGRLQQTHQAEFQKKQLEIQNQVATRRASLQLELSTLIAQWKNALAQARQISSDARLSVPSLIRWTQMRDNGWALPATLPTCLQAGLLLASMPDVPVEASDSNQCLEMPAVLRFPQDTSIAVMHDASGRETALEFLRATLLQLLTSIPPGRVQFTLIDPVGLGQSFSALMHLADFDELLISNRIWTESVQIRDRLQKVTEHMESVFQTYLRSDFATIEEYNAAAGEVAEPYHFVVVAGFPSAFSEEAARHLTSILTSGPRCGVHTLIAWSPDAPMPRSFDIANLRDCCLQFQVVGKRIQPSCMISGAMGKPTTAVAIDSPSVSVEFDSLESPDAASYVSLVRAVGEQSKNARRVEVSFARIAPKPVDVWTHSTADGVDLPIGRAGAARLQYMRLGRGTSQHVLIAGKTGSGKSTLMHILITNLALHYGPDEIQFYLIDFKKGVEFRTYAANRLPHARVVAIESDREFGLSVLERLDEVLQERGELFRLRGVQDVPSFRRQFPNERMPRLLLLIDEFQEFFTSEDRVSSRASLLLDRLIRQGRAFGIHVVLGSQTLGGAYSLARSTLGQVAVRIALQCSEGDAHLILSEENSAARLLTRPGEAIYNDANGLVEGNHPFQIAWLDEDKREELMESLPEPRNRLSSGDRMIVFEGNVLPSMETCGPLLNWLSATTDATRHFVDELPVWVGEPVAIAAPMCVEFRRSGGQNILMVGQEGDQADAIMASMIVSWTVSPGTVEHPASSQMILLHDGRDRDSAERFDKTFPPSVAPRLQMKKAAEADAVVSELAKELQDRESGIRPPDAPEIILVIRNIGQFRSLRRDEDDFGLSGFGSAKQETPASQLGDLIRRGPLVGIHVIVWSDTFSNAMRWLSNTLLREFDNRIAFRLNQTDSASLIDTPAAAALTPGRAILYRDQSGAADRFRPFSWPTADFLQRIRPASTVETTGPGNDDELRIDELTIE